MSALKDLVDSLTSQELQVLFWIAQGYDNEGIAEVMTISVLDVDRARAGLAVKLSKSSVTELSEFARDIGLLKDNGEVGR